VSDPESVFFAFPLGIEATSFAGDFNGLPCEPDVEQLPGSVRSWYPVLGWVAVDGPAQSVVLVPADAPLVHLGAVNTGRVVEHIDQKSPVIMSWALNNHWFVNFKAAQDGKIRLRYSLTSMPGHLDRAEAVRFSAEVRTPPLVLRDRRPPRTPEEAVIEVKQGADLVVGSKVTEDGRGIVVRLLNFRPDEQRLTIDLRRPLAAAWLAHPDEVESTPVPVAGGSASVILGPRNVASLLLRW